MHSWYICSRRWWPGVPRIGLRAFCAFFSAFSARSSAALLRSASSSFSSMMSSRSLNPDSRRAFGFDRRRAFGFAGGEATEVGAMATRLSKRGGGD